MFHQPLHKAPGRPGLGFSIVGGADCPGGALGIFIRYVVLVDFKKGLTEQFILLSKNKKARDTIK